MKSTPIAILLILILTALPAAAQVQFLQAWWMDTGETDTTFLGSGIVQLGDVNSDGLNDFLVGTGEERAFVYFGNTELDTVPDIIISSPDTSVTYFHPIANIGDVNGDGWDDVLFWTMVSWYPSEQCRTYLYFGGEVLDTIPDLIFEGPINYDTNFGYNGSGIGDFNGDGGNDFLVLDRNYSFYPETFKGRAFLYYGGESLDSIPDWQIHGGNPFSSIAWDAAPLGDVNDDGFDDFVMVDYRCEGQHEEENAGVIAVYFGATESDTLADVVI